MIDKLLSLEPTEEMVHAGTKKLIEIEEEGTDRYTGKQTLVRAILRAALAATSTPLAEAVTAAQALVDRLEFIHADPAYMAVWTSNHIHNGPYSGPQYKNELDDLKAALIAIAALPRQPERLIPQADDFHPDKEQADAG
jgi:hypothetical protein